MVLFKNRPVWIFVSIVIILVLSFYHKSLKKTIQEKFQNPDTTESKDTCILDCENKELLHAVKREFETNYVEGFENPIEEPFQDATQLLNLVNAAGGPNLSSLATGLPGVSNLPLGNLPLGNLPLGNLPLGGTSPPNLGAFAAGLGLPGNALSVPGFAAQAPKVIQLHKNNLKVIKRAYKIDNSKCEYNIEYDSSKLNKDGTFDERKNESGYIQATFSKEKDTCTYKPVEVKLLIGPQIIRYDSANPGNIVPTIDYVF